MRAAAINALLDNPDATRLDADFAVYAGVRADTFTPVLRRMRNGRGPLRLLPLSWCWAAFLVGFPWFLYRKFFLIAAILIVVPYIGTMAINGWAFMFAVPMWVAGGLYAKALYVRGALDRIATADALGLSGTRRQHFIARRGGVSTAALLMGVVLLTGQFVGSVSVGALHLHLPQPKLTAAAAEKPSYLLAILLLIAIAPSVMILTYGVFRAHAHWRRESLWTALMLGMVGAPAAAFLEILPFSAAASMPPLLSAAGQAATVGICEEATKFFILLAIIAGSLDFRRPHDWPLLGLSVGVGFAAFENVFAVLASTEPVSLAFARALTAVPMHGAIGMTTGAMIAAATTTGQRAGAIPWGALATAVVLHAIYDFPPLAWALADAKGWPIPTFVAALMTIGPAGIAMFSRSAIRTEREIAEADLCRRRTAWFGWILIIGGTLAMGLGVMTGAADEAKELGDVGPLVNIPLAIFPIVAGVDLVIDERRRRRRPPDAARASGGVACSAGSVDSAGEASAEATPSNRRLKSLG